MAFPAWSSSCALARLDAVVVLATVSPQCRSVEKVR